MFTYKCVSLPVSFCTTLRTNPASSLGTDFNEFDSVESAFICQPFSDITAETPRQLSVGGFGVNLCPVLGHWSGNYNLTRLFGSKHPVNLRIDECRRSEPLFLLLPVIFEFP